MYKKLTITLLLLAVVFLLNTTQSAQAQDVAVAGDGAFIGYNADGDDDFAFVLFRGMTDGASIYFSDDEWTGTEFFDTSEGTLKWTNNTGATIPAGTVLIFTDVDNGGTSTTPPSPNPNFGVNIGLLEETDANISLFPGGEILYAYMGSRNDPQFLAAITNDENGFSMTNNSLNGTGLAEDTTAINLSALSQAQSPSVGATPDGGEYTGSRVLASMSDYLTSLNDESNWLITNSGEDLIADGGFDTTAFGGTPTAVTLSTFTGQGNYNLQLVILTTAMILVLVAGGIFIFRRDKV